MRPNIAIKMNTRLDVHKTYKLYIGGQFVRSESGRTRPALSAGGVLLENVCHASRKDFRDAVVAVRGDRLLVSRPGLPDPLAVRYAFSNTPEATLFSSEGLPAPSFRTDDWNR